MAVASQTEIEMDRQTKEFCNLLKSALRQHLPDILVETIQLKYNNGFFYDQVQWSNFSDKQRETVDAVTASFLRAWLERRISI